MFLLKISLKTLLRFLFAVSETLGSAYQVVSLASGVVLPPVNTVMIPLSRKPRLPCSFFWFLMYEENRLSWTRCLVSLYVVKAVCCPSGAFPRECSSELGMYCPLLTIWEWVLPESTQRYLFWNSTCLYVGL